MTAEFSWNAAAPIPKVASARLVIEFADGRWWRFDAPDPADVELKMDRVPYDRMLDQFFPAVPGLIEPLAAGEVTGVTMRLKAPLGGRINYDPSSPGPGQ